MTTARTKKEHLNKKNFGNEKSAGKKYDEHGNFSGRKKSSKQTFSKLLLICPLPPPSLFLYLSYFSLPLPGLLKKKKDMCLTDCLLKKKVNKCQSSFAEKQTLERATRPPPSNTLHPPSLLSCVFLLTGEEEEEKRLALITTHTLSPIIIIIIITYP